MNDNSLRTNEGHRERLRQRFIHQSERFADIELLELILTYSIPRKDVSPIANIIFQHFGSINTLISAPLEELVTFPGIGESTAILLKAIELIKLKKPTIEQPELFVSSNNTKNMVESERKMRVFVNDEVKNSLQLLPKASSFSNLEAYKNFLVSNLPYNSEETRRRRANYILERFFPTGKINNPLTFFMAHQAQENLLKPIIFYQILKSETLAIKFAEDLIYPLLPLGRINRDQIKEFVYKYLPDTSDSSMKNMLRAFFYTYSLLGVGNTTGEILRFQLHQGDFEPFLYIFTSEFPEPGMFSFDDLYKGPIHRWLLWDREWIRRQLYNLRDLGVISKISEIDNVKQFSVSANQMEVLNRYFTLSSGKTTFLRESTE